MRSNSAMAEMITTTARPSGPPVSKLFPETDKLDVQPVQFIQHFQEVTHAPSQAIASPYQDNIEVTAAGIGQHPVQPGPPGPGAANAVIDVLLHDLKPTLKGYLLKIVKLGGGVWSRVETRM